MKLPRAQVLIHEPRINLSIWTDFESQARTFKGLVRQLREGVKSGKYVGYRLIHVYWEKLGIVDPPVESGLKYPYIPPDPDDEWGF